MHEIYVCWCLIICFLDGDFHPEKAFLSRLLEKGATESSSAGTTTILSEEDRQIDGEKRKSILHNTVNACEDLSNLKSSMSAACLNVLLSDGKAMQGTWIQRWSFWI